MRLHTGLLSCFVFREFREYTSLVADSGLVETVWWTATISSYPVLMGDKTLSRTLREYSWRYSSATADCDRDGQTRLIRIQP